MQTHHLLAVSSLKIKGNSKNGDNEAISHYTQVFQVGEQSQHHIFCFDFYEEVYISDL